MWRSRISLFGARLGVETGKTRHVAGGSSCYAAKAAWPKRNHRSCGRLIGESMPQQTAIWFYAGLVGKEAKVLDLIFIAATVVFFLVAIAYVRGCEKLQ